MKNLFVFFIVARDFDLKHRIIVTIFGEVCAEECRPAPFCGQHKKESDKRRIKTFFFRSPAENRKSFLESKHDFINNLMRLIFLEHNEHQREPAETWFRSHIN